MKYRLIFAMLFILGCGDDNTSQDLRTGEVRDRSCTKQMTVNNSNRGTFNISKETYLDIPTTGITEGSKRIIKLYSHQTCDSRIDTDFFGPTNSYFTLEESYFGTEVTKGRNRIDFTVFECTDINVKSDKCIGEIGKDSGYFFIVVK